MRHHIERVAKIKEYDFHCFTFIPIASHFITEDDQVSQAIRLVNP